MKSFIINQFNQINKFINKVINKFRFKREKKHSKNNPYLKREYTECTKILEHKDKCNKVFVDNTLLLSSNINKSKILVVDSDKENSRNFLINHGNISNEQIYTVDKFSNTIDDNHFRTSFKNYANNTEIIFDHVFCDIVNTPQNTIKEFEPLLKRKKMNKGGCIALTCCLRGVSSREFGKWDSTIRKLALKYNYILEPIKIPEDLRLTSTSTYRIKSNMSDNGAYKKTGRTVTGYYKIN